MEPFISIIIPVFNDPNGLVDTIASLLRQNCRGDIFEIFIVDNGSTDITADTAHKISSKYPNIITVLEEHDIKSSYAARNKGVIFSRGKIICFIDANVTVENMFIYRICDFFDKTDIDYIGCNVETYSEHRTLTAKYQKLEAFNVQWYIENRKFAPTCCMAVKKSVIAQIGPFDSRLESGGDWEFGRRVHTAGFSQAFAEKVVVFHPARWRYRDLIQKNRRCARGDAQLFFHFPYEYKNIQDNIFKIRKYLPRKPWVIRSQFKEKSIEISLIESIIFSIFHIPLNVIRFFSYLNELKRLKTQTFRNFGS